MPEPIVSPEVAAYLVALPAHAVAPIARLRAAIHAAAPGMDEAIGYGIPVVRRDGRAVVGYAAFRAHCSLFPMGSAALDGALSAELAPWRAGKGTLRFTADRPIPDALVARLVHERLAAEAARAAERATRPASARRAPRRLPVRRTPGGEA
ncbi:MAG: iron chaperone [Chloroflexota bacterium]